MSLMYGSYEDLECNEKIYSYIRRYFNQSTLIIFNKSNVPQTISYDVPSISANTNFYSIVKVEGKKMRITVPAYGFEVITIRE